MLSTTAGAASILLKMRAARDDEGGLDTAQEEESADHREGIPTAIGSTDVFQLRAGFSTANIGNNSEFSSRYESNNSSNKNNEESDKHKISNVNGRPELDTDKQDMAELELLALQHHSLFKNELLKQQTLIFDSWDYQG
ncbi:hypothetical protein HDU82_006102 [Entophlyctis luteolus]|nr:hypothetical protein HDU82_006102 [Entophlyctis luteolus]